MKAYSGPQYMYGFLGTCHFQHCIYACNVKCGHVLRSYMHIHVLLSTAVLNDDSISLSDCVFLDFHCISTGVHLVTDRDQVTKGLKLIALCQCMCSCTDVCTCCVYMLCVICCAWVFSCECTCGYHTAQYELQVL